MQEDEPVGLAVARTGRILNRAFDDALAEVGGSLPVWLIVTALKRGGHRTQRDIAAVVGIEGATLTHHLSRMEEAGLVERHRASTNRRVQIVALTPEGDALFVQMLAAVLDFDKRLRRRLSSGELTQLRSALAILRENAASTPIDASLTR